MKESTWEFIRASMSWHVVWMGELSSAVQGLPDWLTIQASPPGDRENFDSSMALIDTSVHYFIMD